MTDKEDDSPTSASSPSTKMTTPEQSLPQSLNNDTDDDIWADDDYNTQHPDQHPQQSEMLSDLPAIKRQHMNAGYREGLSISKAKVIQQGFDQGYPIGIAIGMRVGRILGALEGFLASQSKAVDEPGMKQRELVQKTYERACSELAIPRLLAGIEDSAVLALQTVPEAIADTLERWEGLVMGARLKLRAPV